MKLGILTLTSDFGHDGPYVAAMKGIILGRAPGVTLVDVSHSIAPQNILEGAYVLAGIVDAFPPGTVHLAVVDPGVGTDRRLLAARVADQWFVLPDNGLLSGVLLGRSSQEIREITSESIRRPQVSHTFHGRDLMAPAAAHLVSGGDPAELGPHIDRVVNLANFRPRDDENGGLVGEVIFRDTFGNLITNVRSELLTCNGNGQCEWSLEIAGEKIIGLSRTYGEHEPGNLLAVVGSSGWIEVAVANGDASRHLGVGPGTTVWFRKSLAS